MHRPDAGERVFRALLRLYPREFRARFGDEMVDFYLERRRELAMREGTRGQLRLWLHLIPDMAFSATVEHWRALRRAATESVDWTTPDYPQETEPMEVLRQDIRYALRSLARQPGFVIVAALTLALGIGANTAIYSVVDAVLLRPLPWPDADRLTVVTGTRGGQPSGVVYLDYKDWAAQNSSFEALGVFRGQSVNLTGTETPDRLTGSFVNAAYLRISGGSTIHGRLLTDAETEVATKEPAAVITETVWRTRYGSRPDMIGQTMVINGQPFSVVGILRAGSLPGFTPDVFLPLGYYPNRGDLEVRGRSGIAVMGKLKAGVSMARAQSDLDAIAARLAALYPASNAGTGISIQSLREQIVGPSRMPLAIMLASVGIVLLIACANVANLQLARATARRRELSVRAALGAGRGRIMRQLLTESLVLSIAGGVAGLGIAYAGTQWFASVVPTLLTSYGPIAMNPAVLTFAGIVTIATGILFGIAPAWRASRAESQESLAIRGASASGARLRAHQALVVGQIALCVVLLVSAGLLTRSLVALARVQPGFDPQNVLTLQFRLPVTRYDTEAKIADMFTRTIAEVRSVPGVEHAALVRATPLNGNGESFRYQVDGSGEADPAKLPQAHRNLISPDYFETMRLPRSMGRDFTDQDRLGGMPVAIVNEQLARKIESAGNVVGKRVRLLDGDAPVWATVVGVVGNAKHFTINEPQVDQVYLPYTQRPLIFTEIVARTSADPTTVANAVRSAIWRVDRDQPVWRIRPLVLSIENQLGSRRFQMRLLGSFAVLAVVLALIGVYGVMSYAVARRTQEMGIRMALGARTGDVVGLVLRQGMQTIAIALVLGLVGAVGASKAIRTQLYGVTPTDPTTFVAVAVILAAIAMAACYLPARRASRVDPVTALRSD